MKNLKNPPSTDSSICKACRISINHNIPVFFKKVSSLKKYFSWKLVYLVATSLTIHIISPKKEKLSHFSKIGTNFSVFLKNFPFSFHFNKFILSVFLRGLSHKFLYGIFKGTFPFDIGFKFSFVRNFHSGFLLYDLCFWKKN